MCRPHKAAAEGTRPYIVQTDASQVALGGVLLQEHPEGLRPIAYESRQFTAAEQNMFPGMQELVAVHHCSYNTWRHYLIFTPWRLQGDHEPLSWLLTKKQLSQRQARIMMDLVEINVPRLEHVPGALLHMPDGLSRQPLWKKYTAKEGLIDAGVVRESDGDDRGRRIGGSKHGNFHQTIQEGVFSL